MLQSQCDLENKMEKVQSIFIKEGNNEEIALKGDGLKQKIENRNERQVGGNFTEIKVKNQEN